MIALMKEQQDMESVSDDKPSIQTPSILSRSTIRLDSTMSKSGDLHLPRLFASYRKPN